MKQREVLILLMDNEKVTKTELANRLGICRQAVYSKLGSNMSVNCLIDVLNALGYDLLIKRRVDSNGVSYKLTNK